MRTAWGKRFSAALTGTAYITHGICAVCAAVILFSWEHDLIPYVIIFGFGSLLVPIGLIAIVTGFTSVATSILSMIVTGGLIGTAACLFTDAPAEQADQFLYIFLCTYFLSWVISIGYRIHQNIERRGDKPP